MMSVSALGTTAVNIGLIQTPCAACNPPTYPNAKIVAVNSSISENGPFRFNVSGVGAEECSYEIMLDDVGYGIQQDSCAGVRLFDLSEVLQNGAPRSALDNHWHVMFCPRIVRIDGNSLATPITGDCMAITPLGW